MTRLNNNASSSVNRVNEQLKALDIPNAVSSAQAAIASQQASGISASSATNTVSPELRAFYASNGTLPAPSETSTTSNTTTSSSQMFYQMLQLMQIMMSQAFSNMSNSSSNTASTSTSNTTPTDSTSDTTTDSTASSTSATSDDTSQLDSLTSSLLDKTLNQVNGTGVDVNKTLDYVKKMTKMSQNLFQ